MYTRNNVYENEFTKYVASKAPNDNHYILWHGAPYIVWNGSITHSTFHSHRDQQADLLCQRRPASAVEVTTIRRMLAAHIS